MVYLHPKISVLPMILSLLLSPTNKWMGAQAIITKENPSDAIVSDRSAVKFFVSLFEKGDCAGTVIGSRFVVTAAHCVCGATSDGVVAIDYRDKRYSATKSYQNPSRQFNCKRDGPNSNDVAVLEFERGVFADHDPRRVYSKLDEVSKTIWILGMGLSGQPDDYPTVRSCRQGTTDGRLREGFNTVLGAGNGVVTYDMSRSGEQLDREAIAQDGDSGGPALIYSSGEWMVAGANSGTNENNSCNWGSVDIFCRLSEHAAWIDRATNENLDGSTRGLWFTYNNDNTNNNNENDPQAEEDNNNNTGSGGDNNNDDTNNTGSGGNNNDVNTEPPTDASSEGSSSLESVEDSSQSSFGDDDDDEESRFDDDDDDDGDDDNGDDSGSNDFDDDDEEEEIPTDAPTSVSTGSSTSSESGGLGLRNQRTIVLQEAMMTVPSSLGNPSVSIGLASWMVPSVVLLVASS